MSYEKYNDMLLPCPFCGGEAEMHGLSTWLSRPFVACKDCGTESAVYDSEAEAIAAWNTRAEMGYEDALILLDEMGLSERTCRIIEYTDAPISICSECGAVQPDDYAVYYCWSCGARVVGE